MHYKRWRRSFQAPCTVEGCDKLQDARGLCAAHYKRYRYHGTVADIPKIVVLCKIEGCDKKHKGLGFCSMHYNQYLKMNPNNQYCSEKDCMRKAYSDGICRTHISEKRKTQLCSFEGCVKLVRTTDLCDSHYRQMRAGGPLRPLGVRLRDLAKGNTPKRSKAVRKAPTEKPKKPKKSVPRKAEVEVAPYIPGTLEHTSYEDARKPSGYGYLAAQNFMVLREMSDHELSKARSVLRKFNQPEEVYEMLGL